MSRAAGCQPDENRERQRLRLKALSLTRTSHLR